MNNEDEMLVSKHVLPLADYNAGMSIAELKRKYNVSRISKLASNENPFGTADSVKAALSDIGNLAQYPDPACSELRQLLSRQLEVPETHLAFGNGSEDLINMICHTFLETGDKVLTVVPSFGLHILYPKSHGAEVITSFMTEKLEFDIDDLTSKLKQDKPKVFFIASPSNPVGCTLKPHQLDKLIQSQQPETLFVFDEAYYEFAAYEEGYEDVLAKLQAAGKPYILLRTLSKAYSLAGVRVGFAVCSSESFPRYLNKIRLPFNVNQIAQRAAVAALTDEKHLEKTLSWNQTAREEMYKQLCEMGIQPASSHGNFLFFETSFPSKELAEELLKLGVIVKPWLEQGYQNFIRVSIGNEEENQHFISSLATILHSKNN